MFYDIFVHPYDRLFATMLFLKCYTRKSKVILFYKTLAEATLTITGRGYYYYYFGVISYSYLTILFLCFSRFASLFVFSPFSSSPSAPSRTPTCWHAHVLSKNRLRTPRYRISNATFKIGRVTVGIE